MAKTYDIGIKEALSITFDAIETMKPVTMPVHESCGHVAAEDLRAVVDCPSVTSSLRDGYAVLSSDIAGASGEQGVSLRIAGSLAAGDPTEKTVRPGEAVEVLTGAVIPKGADAVVSVEFTERQGDRVICYRDAPPGCNLLFQGSDVPKNGLIAGGKPGPDAGTDRFFGRRRFGSAEGVSNAPGCRCGHRRRGDCARQASSGRPIVRQQHRYSLLLVTPFRNVRGNRRCSGSSRRAQKELSKTPFGK